MATQPLEFLTHTNFTLPRSEESRRIVRSHAIRDANRRKNQPVTKSKNPPDRTKSKPLPQATFTAKFRIDGKGKQKTPVEKAGAMQDRSDVDVDGILKALAREVRAAHHGKGMKNIPNMPGIGRFDPFDTLPVKIGVRQQALIEYQNAALKQNAFAFYSKDKLFSYAAADSAWLNATLCLISLHYDLKQGHGVSSGCLFHRGEALRIVNERLMLSPRVVSDETIGAIASLANFDTTNGFFSSATIHLHGLISIVSYRGGSHISLNNLEGNDLLQKLVAWSDLSYSTAWDLEPQFPILRTPECNASLNQFLDLLTSILPSESLNTQSPHDLFGDMTQIFQSLRFLSVIMAQPSITPRLQSIFTRGLYICEYKLLVVLDQTDPRDDDFVLNRNSHIYGSTRLAAYLYLYIMLRELPRTAEICVTLTKRLISVLKGDGKGDLLVVWSQDRWLLNWVAFMGALAMPELSEGAFFVGILRRVKKSLALETLGEFKDALREVMWIDDPCWEKGCSLLWLEISDAASP